MTPAEEIVQIFNRPFKHAKNANRALASRRLNHAQIANRASFPITDLGPALKQLLDDGIIIQEQIDGRTVFRLA